MSLSYGSEGADVFAMQQKLIDKHYTYGQSDYYFDRRTEWAVKYFQKKNGLTVDGIVGPATMNKLNSSNAVIGVSSGIVGRNIGDQAEPNIKMGNSLWSSVAFDADYTSGVETIGTSGNAPTAIAITFTTLWENSIIPPVIATWAKANGYRDEYGNTGVTSSFFNAVAGEWDVRYDGTTSNLSDIQSYIALGGLCVVRIVGNSAHSYCSTSGATYVVVYKVDSNYVYLVNSNGGSQSPVSRTTWQNASWVKEAHRYGVGL